MVLRILARDSAIYGGADLASKIIAFFAFPLIAAALSPSEFGALELLLTATTLLGIVANCGINNSLQRFYWDTETETVQRPMLVSSGLATLGIFLLTAIGISTLFLAAFRSLGDEWESTLTWIGLLSSLVLMGAGQIVQYLLDVTRLHMRPWRFVGIALISRVMTAVAAVFAVVWMAWGLDGLLIAQALITVAAIPLALFAVRKDLTSHIEYRGIVKLVQFGYPFIFAGLAFWLFGSMDRWLLASMTTVEEVGVYSVAYRFATVILFISMAFGQAWSPLAMKIRTDHPARYRSLYVDILLILLCVMLLIGGSVALFATDIIGWLMPMEYHSAAIPLAALSLGLVLQSTLQLTAVGISIEKKTYLFGRLSWIAALANLVFNLAMIPTLGALGASIATSLSYLLLTGAYLYYTQRLHPLPLPWGKIVILITLWALIACNIAAMWLDFTLANSVAWRGLLLFVCLLVCSLVLPWRTILYIDR